VRVESNNSLSFSAVGYRIIDIDNTDETANLTCTQKECEITIVEGSDPTEECGAP
jgi:hypothetical protein